MRVGIDVSQIIDGTGVSHYTLSLFNNLDKKVMIPFAFTLTQSDKIKTSIPSTKIIPIGRRHTNLLWNKLHLNIDLLIRNVDLLHTSDWTEPKTKVVKVTTIHDLTPFLFPNLTPPEIVKVHTQKMYWAVLECSKFLCVSKSTANDLMRIFNIPSKKIEIIYESASENLINLTPVKRQEKEYILAMGSKQPRKNIERLIKSYKKYKYQYKLPDKLVITGENNLSTDDQNIEFTGYVSDQELANLMYNSSVFVYPSLYEGFGQPILEAFHFKTPVVTSNTSSLPEAAGDAAILIDPLSEESIAKGIKSALVDRENLIKAGQKQLKNFSWEKAGSATMEVYKSLCS